MAHNTLEELLLSPITLDQFELLIRRCIQAELAEMIQRLETEPDEIMDGRQVCEEFQISMPTLIKYRKEGRVPFFRIGNRVRYRKREVVEGLRG